VVPSEQEVVKARTLADYVLGKVMDASKQFNEIKEVILGGSFAKGTWLPRGADIDIFLKISPKVSESRFEKVGLEVGSSAMKGYQLGKKYAQHPYTEAVVQGVKVNIVPCYDVRKGEWKSAADRSPFHVEVVKGMTQEQKRQVRLLKGFMIAVGVYGAEIETQGFSGYLAEVLVLKHGTFLNTIMSFADFVPSGNQGLFSLPDPVDETRDLGIAVSGEKLGRMVLAARAFLAKPDESYFKTVAGRIRPKMKGRLVALIFTHERLSEDVLWGELRKSLKHIVRHVEEKGFRIARSSCASNNIDSSAFLLMPEYEQLPELMQRVGPSVTLRQESQRFVAANEGKAMLVWVDGEARLRLLQKRDHTRFVDMLAQLARHDAISIGVSKEVLRGLGGSRILVGFKALKSENEKWLLEGVREIVSDTAGIHET
jgi:tRNA nucleotidyltransferase (CCA-adding enzyme)